jgi:hypothetical protein
MFDFTSNLSAMTKKWISGLGLVLSSLTLFGQTVSKITLQPSPLTSPYEETNKEYCPSVSLPLQPVTDSYMIPADLKNPMVFTLGIDHLIQPVIWRPHFQPESSRHSILVASTSQPGQYAMIIDRNGNRDFSDDKKVMMVANSTFSVGLPFQAERSTGQTIVIPVEFNINETSGIIHLECRSLLAYTLTQTLEDSTLTLRILVNRHGPANFKLRNPLLGPVAGTQNILLDEVFSFNRKLYKLSNLDIVNQTVDWITPEDGEKVYGYKEDHFIMKDKIKEAIEAYTIGPTAQIPWDNNDYVVLHFWQPTAMGINEEELNTMKSLARNANVFVAGFPVFSAEPHPDVVKDLIRKSGLPGTQMALSAERAEKEGAESMLPLNGIYPDVPMKQPDFILLNSDGRILFRSHNLIDLQHALKKRRLL